MDIASGPDGTIRQPDLESIDPMAIAAVQAQVQNAAAAGVDPADVVPADVQYTLVRMLGKGTYGEVYEAIAPGGFRVAIKRIQRPVNDPASQGEIESLEAMKAMSHPFLVQTHAYWVFRDRLVIVMDLADGSLAGRVDHFKEKGLPGVPPEELIPFFEQAAEALDYLHRQNVSHRDVKPENLLLSNGYAKVADFGLAREHEHQETTIAVEMGTPLFMAPEVWKRKVNLHSDQYSLAATYVHARLGRPLFAATSIGELCIMHLQETPNLDPLKPAEQKVLLRALAKAPEDRFPSCVAFAKALREAVLTERKSSKLVYWILATALVVGLASFGLYKLLHPQPDNPLTPQEPELPAKELWCPKGWQAEPGEPVVVGVTELHQRLTRTVAGEKLVAILIASSQENNLDLPSFYMLENKITNRVFAETWDEASNDTKSELSRYRNLPYVKPFVATLLPGKWKSGAIDIDGKDLGIKDDQAGVPVVGVTVPEAILVAAQLGGRLPTHAQWLKAVGARADSQEPGPAGAPAVTGEDVSVTRPLALGLKKGPWPVEKKTKDISVYGIHQLVTNGCEWCDGDSEAGRVNLFERHSSPPMVRQTGRSWMGNSVLTFDLIADDLMRLPWTETDSQAGFRIVLIPR